MIEILVPIIIPFIHVFLMYNEWKKSDSSFKITNIVVLVILIFFSFINIFTVLSESDSLAYVGMFLVIWPVFGIVLLGWLIRWIVIKRRR